jgi:hypothetical protein
MDIKLRHLDDDGKVLCEFTVPNAKESTSRWFSSENSAQVMAVFVAAQQGVVKEEHLMPWLKERGFPECQPSLPEVEETIETSNVEITEIKD